MLLKMSETDEQRLKVLIFAAEKNDDDEQDK